MTGSAADAEDAVQETNVKVAACGLFFNCTVSRVPT
ncbi:hypothetical protein [Paenibacillus spongiae]|uniref:Uncharacterized protein n=1 Tax=Paenibacillus spongiae TaxID=2909671 RepID=A0ABY5S0M7_9BACL|nr:hypothetical protein [Paenibacillus spongiae]UVI27401.1 hypothetical protein L1F29_18175 [Paenibacillus spongiae]